MVEFGGITTKYLLGANRHVATLTFSVNEGATGVAEFEGQVVGVADSNSNNQVIATPFSFGKVGSVSLVIGALPRSLRHRERQSIGDQLSTLGQLRSRRSSQCSVLSGPYPIGDVNGDCAFDTTDALVTAQYLEINSFGQQAIDGFFNTKESQGIIQGNRQETPMDVDFNQQVMVADVQTMV